MATLEVNKTCTMIQKRNTNIEVLRLVLMLAIFSWHILVHGYGFKDIGGGNMEYLSDEVGIMLASLFAPATYCFMFISGYYGLKFSFKKGFSLELWLIITSLLTYILGGYIFESISIRGIVTSCFPVSTLKWWFMTCYMLIFLLSPILNKGIESLNKNRFLMIIVSLVAYQTCSFLRFHNNGGSNFLGLLTIFLIGRYFKIYNIQIKKKVAFFLFVACWIFLIALMLFADHYSKTHVFTLLNYNTPLIMTMAISLFYYVKGMTPSYSLMINSFLKPVLFIYLITDGLFVPFYKWIVSVLHSDMILGVLLYVTIPIVCLLIGHTLIKLVDVLVSKINIKKIEEYVRQ